jgi:excisionase family DNA binding protein
MQPMTTTTSPGPEATPSVAYLDKPSAAAMLGIKPRTLDFWMHKRLVPYFRIGRTIRFDANDLREHLRAKHRVA